MQKLYFRTHTLCSHSIAYAAQKRLNLFIQNLKDVIKEQVGDKGASCSMMPKVRLGIEPNNFGLKESLATGLCCPLKSPGAR